MGLRIASLLFVAAALTAGGADARGKGQSADLSGLWTNVTATPLERPAAFTALTATDAQAAAWLKTYAEANAASDDHGDPVGGGASEWWERGTTMQRIGGHFRTSMIVEPADGKLPLSTAGRKTVAEAGRYSSDNPEQRSPVEQCFMGGSSSSSVPMLPHRSLSLYKFVQSPGHLVIWMESGHDPRIIRMSHGPHLPPHMQPWAGDSLGHWEGRTLVVETTNLAPREALRFPTNLYVSPGGTVTERFTRLSKTEILYGFTVDDPATYTQAWRAELILSAAKGPIYEYACHEGNYSLPGILAGARHEEQVAAGK